MILDGYHYFNVLTYIQHTHTRTETHRLRHTQIIHTETHTVSQRFWYRNLFAKFLFAKLQMSSGLSGPMFTWWKHIWYTMVQWQIIPVTDLISPRFTRNTVIENSWQETYGTANQYTMQYGVEWCPNLSPSILMF